MQIRSLFRMVIRMRPDNNQLPWGYRTLEIITGGAVRGLVGNGILTYPSPGYRSGLEADVAGTVAPSLARGLASEDARETRLAAHTGLH